VKGQTIYRTLSRPAVLALGVAGVLVAVSLTVASGSDSDGDGEDAPRTFEEAGCQEALQAAARERWPRGERSGFGTEEEAVLEEESDRVGGEAATRWPEAFAGAWGEQPEGDRFYLAFTEGAQAKVDELAESHPCPQLLQAVSPELSMEELVALQDEIHADLELVRAGELDLPAMPELFESDIDPSQNAVLIFLPELTPEVADLFTERYGDHVVLEERELGTPDFAE